MKYRLIGSGTRLSDNYRASSGDTIEIWQEGRTVYYSTANSTSPITAKCFGKDVKNLIWEENGRVSAVLVDGDVQYVGNLTPTPGKYKAYDQVIEDKKAQDAKNSKKKKEESSDDDDEKGPIWWLIIVWIFKGIWWIIKGIWKFFWGLVEGVDKFGK